MSGHPVGQANGHPVGQVNGLVDGQAVQQVRRQRLARHALLHRLGALGYVGRVGDFGLIRRISPGSCGLPAGQPAGQPAGFFPSHSPSGSPSHSPGDSAGSSPGDPAGSPPGAPAERVRLVRLVELATDLVDSVTSDSALGNIAVRIDRVGDLWMIRQFSADRSAGSSADPSANGLLNGLPNDLPNGLTNHPPLHRPDGSSESQAERQRLDHRPRRDRRDAGLLAPRWRAVKVYGSGGRPGAGPASAGLA